MRCSSRKIILQETGQTLTELKTQNNLIGRTASVKEIANFEITENNISVFLEMLKMFGILSNSHKHDILQIINTILL